MIAHTFRLLAGLLMLPLVAACGAAATQPQTNMTYDRQYNFSGVHKIYIEPSSRTDAATIMVSDGQIARIDGAIADALRGKGLEVVDASMQADLFLSWYLITEDPVSSADCPSCDMTVDGGKRYARGTLVVDMTDPLRNRPVWRTVLQTKLTGDPNSAGAEQARRAAAAALFADFPPR